jgi:diguanylate cyclase (GGDEF)-like protein/PAS domain S-box-containing protein
LTDQATHEMEDLLQFLYLMPAGVIKFRADGAVDMMNPAAAAMLLSLSSADALQDIYLAMLPIAPGLRRLVTEYAEPAGTIVDQERLRASAGRPGLVTSLTVNKIKDNVYMAVLTDVTRLAEQEEKLYVDQRKFRAIFDNVRDYAIYTITMDGHIEEWNPSMQRYAGWLPEDVEGRSIEMFTPPDDPDRPRLAQVLAEAERIGSTEVEGWRLKRDGSRLWANSVITALPDDSGTVHGFVVVSRDITERKRLEDRMKELATVDPLTGAYNRRKGDELLVKEFSRRAIHGTPFTVLMIDIDHFKSVNDRFGHAAGDAVLCEMVQICRKALRPIDMVVRWGGEEFLVLLPETDATSAMAVAERVRAAVAAAEVVPPGSATICFTVSIGVAVPASAVPSELLSRSDEALYTAKAGGRNQVVLAS